MKRTQHRVGCGLLEIGPSMHHKLFPCLPPFQVRWKPMNAYFIVASIATTISNTPVPAIFLFLCVLISRRAFFGRHTTLNLLLDKEHLQGRGYTSPPYLRHSGQTDWRHADSPAREECTAQITGSGVIFRFFRFIQERYHKKSKLFSICHFYMHMP